MSAFCDASPMSARTGPADSGNESRRQWIVAVVGTTDRRPRTARSQSAGRSRGIECSSTPQSDPMVKMTCARRSRSRARGAAPQCFSHASTSGVTTSSSSSMRCAVASSSSAATVEREGDVELARRRRPAAIESSSIDERPDGGVEEREVCVANPRGPHRGRELVDVLVAAVQRAGRQSRAAGHAAHAESVDADGRDLVERGLEQTLVVLLRRQRSSSGHSVDIPSS